MILISSIYIYIYIYIYIFSTVIKFSIINFVRWFDIMPLGPINIHPRVFSKPNHVTTQI